MYRRFVIFASVAGMLFTLSGHSGNPALADDSSPPLDLPKSETLPPLAKNGKPVATAPADPKAAETKKPADEKPTDEKNLTWVSLFDGKKLGDWKPINFGGEGEVAVKDEAILLPEGSPLTGIKWSGKYEKQNYELAVEAKRVEGGDFFCGLTFPVGENSCSLICGGWGGTLVGISSFDGQDASENETTQFKSFKSGVWYKIRVRVTPEKIKCWIDDEQVVNVEIGKKEIDVRGGFEPTKPLGVGTYQTAGALRNFKQAKIAEPPAK